MTITEAIDVLNKVIERVDNDTKCYINNIIKDLNELNESESEKDMPKRVAKLIRNRDSQISQINDMAWARRLDYEILHNYGKLHASNNLNTSDFADIKALKISDAIDKLNALSTAIKNQKTDDDYLVSRLGVLVKYLKTEQDKSNTEITPFLSNLITAVVSESAKSNNVVCGKNEVRAICYHFYCCEYVPQEDNVKEFCCKNVKLIDGETTSVVVSVLGAIATLLCILCAACTDKFSDPNGFDMISTIILGITSFITVGGIAVVAIINRIIKKKAKNDKITKDDYSYRKLLSVRKEITSGPSVFHVAGNLEVYYKIFKIPCLDKNNEPICDKQGNALFIIIPQKYGKKLLFSGKSRKLIRRTVLSGNLKGLALNAIYNDKSVQNQIKAKSGKDVSEVIDLEQLTAGEQNNKLLTKLLDDLRDQWVERQISSIKNSIMAKSIRNSLKYNKKCLKSVKEYAEKDIKEKPFYFISAISKKHKNQENNSQNTDEATLEYQVAKKLVDKLGKENVFWWENGIESAHDEDGNPWPISAKIAVALGFSTVFIGLAFDSVEQVGQKYKYSCLLEGEEAYKEPQYFLHEVATYSRFINDSGDKSSKKFVKGIVSKHDYKTSMPKKRFMRFYSLGEPDEYSKYPMFDNMDGSASLRKARSKCKLDFLGGRISQIVKEEADIEIKAANIADIIYKQICAEQKAKENALPAPEKSTEKYDGLLKPFVLRDFDNGDYYDDFLARNWARDKEYKWILNNSLNENEEAVPNDYEFKYAIVDDSGKNAKNHFLVFPERYYDERGNFKWRIKLVIRDWNLRAIVDDDYRKFLCKTSNDSSLEHKTDANFPLSEFTEIAFYQDVEEINNIFNADATERASCQTYSDIVDIVSESNTGIDNGCAFILNNDMHDKNKPIYHLKGVIKLCDPASPKAVKYFYISVNFYPKRIVYKYNAKKLKLSSPKKSPTRCPFCGRIRTADSKYQQNGDYCYSGVIQIGKEYYRSCAYNFIGLTHHNPNAINLYTIDLPEGKNSYKDIEDKNNYIYSLRIKDAPGMRPIDENFRDYCLTYKDEYDDGVVITMVGISGAGKSTFISRMLGVHGKDSVTDEDSVRKDISCGYLTNAMRPYVTGEVEFINALTCKMIKDAKTNWAYLKGINGLRLLNDYNSVKYQQFLMSTPNEKFDPVTTHMPFAISLNGIQSNNNRKLFLSFFDLPGGTFGAADQDKITLSEVNKDYTVLNHSDSVIILLDANKSTFDDIQAMTEIINFLDKETIVAIVLCKADELFRLKNYSLDYARRSSVVARNDKFGGSLRQFYINQCSEEIYKKIIEKQDLTLIKKLKQKFTHNKFFVTSALGRGDSIIFASEKEKYTLYETSPLNIENVLLWIMYEKGIIE